VKLVFRRALLAAAIIMVLLPLVELGDHWESYGSDPEFVSVLTVAVISLGFLLFRQEIVFVLRRFFWPTPVSNCGSIAFSHFLVPLIQDGLPDIRAPIRI
jgi:hypothetical protein